MLGVQPEVSCCHRKCFFLRLWVSDPVQSPVTKCPHLYLNCRRACIGYILYHVIAVVAMIHHSRDNSDENMIVWFQPIMQTDRIIHFTRSPFIINTDPVAKLQ